MRDAHFLLTAASLREEYTGGDSERRLRPCGFPVPADAPCQRRALAAEAVRVAERACAGRSIVRIAVSRTMWRAFALESRACWGPGRYRRSFGLGLMRAADWWGLGPERWTSVRAFEVDDVILAGASSLREALFQNLASVTLGGRS